MKFETISRLFCPDCGGSKFSCQKFDADKLGVYEGKLICGKCRNWFKIEKGIADLLPLSLRREDLYQTFASNYKIPFERVKSGGAKNVSDKFSQINFFKENVLAYEKSVVDSKYYQVLDRHIFDHWIKGHIGSSDLVLDLGCGTGRQAIPLAKMGVQVVGVDISEEMLFLASEKIKKNGLGEYIDLIVADAENLPLKNNIFDACIAYGTFHHLKNPSASIKKLSKTLHLGAEVLSLDPNKSTLRFIFDLMMKIWKLYKEETGEGHLISGFEITDWFTKAGIKGNVKLSTYLPPHLFYFMDRKKGQRLLEVTDTLFNMTTILRSFAGVVIFEGRKQCK